jgi:hypothetical protein
LERGATDLIYTLGRSSGGPKGMRMRGALGSGQGTGNNFSGGTITDISRKQTDIRFDLQWRVAFN